MKKLLFSFLLLFLVNFAFSQHSTSVVQYEEVNDIKIYQTIDNGTVSAFYYETKKNYIVFLISEGFFEFFTVEAVYFSSVQRDFMYSGDISYGGVGGNLSLLLYPIDIDINDGNMYIENEEIEEISLELKTFVGDKTTLTIIF